MVEVASLVSGRVCGGRGVGSSCGGAGVGDEVLLGVWGRCAVGAGGGVCGCWCLGGWWGGLGEGFRDIC